MEETEHQNTMRALKAVMTAIKSVQKIMLVGNEFVLLPKHEFDEVLSMVELLFKSGKRLNYLEHKIEKVTEKQAAPIIIEAPRADVLPPASSNPEALLTARQVADEWGIKVKTLEKWRFTGDGPAYVKLGKGIKAIVRYRRRDMNSFVSELERKHTSQK